MRMNLKLLKAGTVVPVRAKTGTHLSSTVQDDLVVMSTTPVPDDVNLINLRCRRASDGQPFEYSRAEASFYEALPDGVFSLTRE